MHVYTWSNFVGAVLRLSCILRTQMALEKELGTSISTVLQVNVKTILLNAVRIWWNYNNRVLRTNSFIHPAAPHGATKLFCPRRKAAGPPLSHQGGEA